MPNISGKNKKNPNPKKENPSVPTPTQALPSSMSESRSPAGANSENKTKKKRNKKKATATTVPHWIPTQTLLNFHSGPTAASAKGSNGRFVKNSNVSKTASSKEENPPSNTEDQPSSSASLVLEAKPEPGDDEFSELAATLQKQFMKPKPIPHRPQPKFTVTAEMRQKIALMDTEQPECVELSSDEEGRATNTNSPSTSSKNKSKKVKSRDASSDIDDPDRYSPSQPLDLPEVDIVLNDSEDDGRESPESPVYSDEEQEEDKEESLETSAQEQENKVSAVTLKLCNGLPSNHESNGHSLEHITKILDLEKFYQLPPDIQAICRMAIARGVEGTFIGEEFCNRDLLQVAARSIFQSLYPEEDSEEEKENFMYLTYAMAMSKRDFLTDYTLNLLEQAHTLIVNHGGPIKGKDGLVDLMITMDAHHHFGGEYWTYEKYEEEISNIYQMLGKDDKANDEVFEKHGQQLPPAVVYALKGYKLLETHGGPQMEYQCKPIMEFEWTERG